MNHTGKTILISLVLCLLLAACAAPAATPTAEPQKTTEPPAATEAVTAETTTTEAAATTEAAPAEEVTLKIGFTASQTGKLNVESTRQVNGLNLWIDQTNKAGGLKVGNKVIKFETVSYDDESTKDRVQELYTRLATEDNADFLISPYSSGLTDAAAVIAEQYGKIMITTGAASESTYTQGYTLVYQAYTPASGYLSGAIDMLGSLDPSAKKIAIVHENDKFSTDVATAAEAYAKSKGYDVLMNEGYDTGTTDFSAIINKVQAAAPDALLGGGHFADGSTLARQISEKNVTLKMLTLLVAPPEPKFTEVGDGAEGVIGPSQWEPGVTFSEDTAKSMNIPWFGPSQEEFIDAYKAAYNEDPSYHSAGGYAAGLLLGKAIQDAGSTDTDAIKAALDSMDILTFFGHIKFDTSAEKHGLQIGHTMVYIQWQKDASGNFAKQIVWPSEAAQTEPLYPKP